MWDGNVAPIRIIGGSKTGIGTDGSVFLDATGKIYVANTSLNDVRSTGYDPIGLIKLNGELYGTTSAGGPFGKGTFYRISTNGTEKALYSFGLHKSDGSSPQANLINVNGTLYGTTYYGGSRSSRCDSYGVIGCGVVFALSL